ncbi:MAG: AAA family ATPase, partial [Acidobacteriota bacterium]
ILDLNNKELVSSRGKVISYWGDRLQEVRERRAGRFFELLGQALDARLEFAGAIRQVAASQLFAWLEKANQQHWLTSRRFEEEKELVEVTRALSVELAVQIAKFSTVQQDLSLFPESCRGLVEEILERDAPHMLVSPDTAFEVTRGGAMAAYATQAESDLTSPSVIERSARINHIEIVNFKAIDSLKFDPSQDPVELLPRYGSSDERLDATAWTVLLGENGSGKSSIMQAIALALAGDQLDGLLDDAKLSWRKLLRRGQSEGRVLLGFSGGSRIELRFDAERHWWGSGSAPRMAAYVRGYGATRLLEGDEIPTEEHGHVRVANLLNPRAPVIDAERWLLDLEEEDFHTAARTITSFIGTDDPMATSEDTPAPLLSRNLARKEIELVDGAPLSYASDGYRAIIALICDVMAGLGEGMADMRNATGIVLIDEIGAHLHPRWKVQITSRLRREFPQLQFLVSTHEPLCLRGLFAEEVWYVAKESSGPDSSAVEVEQIERSPNDYRVDQLLTSEFFGLGTTIDPDIDRRFQVYYRLLAMKPEERAANGPSWTVGTWEDELERLHNELEDYSRPVLGYTRRDQLVYAAIDEFLKKEGQLPVKDRKKRRQKTLDKIQDIWRPPSFLKDLGDEKP